MCLLSRIPESARISDRPSSLYCKTYLLTTEVFCERGDGRRCSQPLIRPLHLLHPQKLDIHIQYTIIDIFVQWNKCLNHQHVLKQSEPSHPKEPSFLGSAAPPWEASCCWKDCEPTYGDAWGCEIGSFSARIFRVKSGMFCQIQKKRQQTNLRWKEINFKTTSRFWMEKCEMFFPWVFQGVGWEPVHLCPFGIDVCGLHGINVAKYTRPMDSMNPTG